MTSIGDAPSAKTWRSTLLEEPLLVVFSLYALSLPFARLILFKVGESGAMITDVLLGVVWITALVRVLTGKLKLRLDALLGLGVLAIGAELLSMIVARKLGVSAVVKLGAFGGMILLPWLLRHVLAPEGRAIGTERVDVVMRAWLAGSVVTVAIGVLGFIGFYADREGLGMSLMCGWGALPPQKIPRLCAPFNNPNSFENYLMASLPIALFVFKDRFTALPSARSALPWLYFAAAAFVAVFTLSAGMGGVAITAALAFLAWRRYDLADRFKPNRALSIVLVGGATLVALFFLGSMVATLQPAGQGDIHLGSQDLKIWDGTRIDVWSTNRWRERPVTGVGYGELASLVENPRCWIPHDQLVLITEPQPPHLMDGHSIPLNVLAQAGIVGLAAFVVLFVALTRGVLWGRAKDVGDRSVRVARDLVAASLVGSFLFHGLFGSFEESRHLWLLFGMGVALADLARRPSSHIPA